MGDVDSVRARLANEAQQDADPIDTRELPRSSKTVLRMNDDQVLPRTELGDLGSAEQVEQETRMTQGKFFRSFSATQIIVNYSFHAITL